MMSKKTVKLTCLIVVGIMVLSFVIGGAAMLFVG